MRLNKEELECMLSDLKIKWGDKYRVLKYFEDKPSSTNSASNDLFVQEDDNTCDYREMDSNDEHNN